MYKNWISFVRFVLLAALGSTALLALAQAPAPSQAIFQYQGSDREARLLEKAKQEGLVTVYTSLAPTVAKPLVVAFEKKTGIKVNMWRGLSDGVLQRALAEARGNLNAVDVIETNSPEMEALAREQILAAIYSPYLADVPSVLMPKHGLWIPDRLNFFVVAYNTSKVRREDLPKTYEGFLDAKWKGRIALEATDSEWMAGVFKTWGTARGTSFFNKLSDMKPSLRKGHLLLTSMVASGDIDVGLTAYKAEILSEKKHGAPVDWAAVEPVIARPQGLGVARHAAHPNAALLFADFMLSPQAQEMLAGMDKDPVSRKVKTDTSSINYVMSDPSVVLDENDKWLQLWDKTFLKK